MKLEKKIFFTGEIHTLTGLKIGGSITAMAIGGIDSPIIRNPLNNKPYIPGSSLKGKMRSLIELRDGTLGNKKMGKVVNGPSENPDSHAAKLFGNSSGNEKQRPSRIMVFDGELLNDEKDFINTDLPYTESKTEVVIDRITSAAMPRTIERVPAGARFKLNMVLNIFEGDNEQQLVNDIISALQLVQNDYLGGAGSRGSGKVKFKINSVKVRSAAFYKNMDNEKDYPIELPNELK